MSNKLLALLILIGTISGIFLMYFYFFVGYTGEVIIESNISNYKVELYTKKLGKTFDYTCETSPCVLNDVSPLSYTLRANKEGYTIASQNLEVSARNSINIRLAAIKDVRLEEISQVNNEISNKDKISLLRDKKRAYKLFDFQNGSYAYFAEAHDAELTLYSYSQGISQRIGNFPVSDMLDVQTIEDTDFLYVQIGGIRYLYDINKGSIQSLDLGVDVHYIKRGKSKNLLVFITSVGAYIYSINTSTLEYFYLFKDFVYLEDDYIGVIYADEDKKLQNFGLEEKKSNLIIRYNPTSKEKEILYETAINIDKIYLQDGGVSFESEGKRYQLENL